MFIKHAPRKKRRSLDLLIPSCPRNFFPYLLFRFHVSSIPSTLLVKIGLSPTIGDPYHNHNLHHDTTNILDSLSTLFPP